MISGNSTRKRNNHSKRGLIERKKANWQSSQEVLGAFGTAKVINAERIRFKIHGNDYRLIVAYRFDVQIAWIKFIGTHAEYDRIDAKTVSKF